MKLLHILPKRNRCLLAVLFGLPLFVTGCAQLQMQRVHALIERQNKEHWQKEYRNHVESLPKWYAEEQAGLQKVARAAWEWSAECDSCAEEDLPAPIYLSDEECKAVVAILKQSRPMAPLPSSYFENQPPLYDVSSGDDLVSVKVDVTGGCCGGVNCSLVFYDEQGDAVHSWDENSTARESQLVWWSTNVGNYRPYSYLPDALYEQLLQQPSYLKAKKTDAELQRKLAH